MSEEAEDMTILGFPVVVNEKMKKDEIKIVVGDWSVRIPLILKKQKDGTLVLKIKDKEKS